MNLPVYFQKDENLHNGGMYFSAGVGLSYGILTVKGLNLSYRFNNGHMNLDEHVSFTNEKQLNNAAIKMAKTMKAYRKRNTVAHMGVFRDMFSIAYV